MFHRLDISYNGFYEEKKMKKLFLFICFIIFIFCQNSYVKNSYAYEMLAYPHDTYWQPWVHMSNVKVNFITDRKIEIKGNVQFFNLFSKPLCNELIITDLIEAYINFEYTTENGKFNDLWLDSRCSEIYYDNPYHYTDGIWRNKFVSGNGKNYYSYPVTDSNRDGWLLKEPYYSYTDKGQCDKLVNTNDNGRIFSFDKIFTIPDVMPTPTSEYRVNITLDWGINNSHGFGCSMYFRDFYGPFPIKTSPAYYQSANRAILNLKTGTLHIPLLYVGNLTNKQGDYMWIDLKLDTMGSEYIFVVDLNNKIGGIGVTNNFDMFDADVVAMFKKEITPLSDSYILYIPEVDAGNGKSYWLKLKLYFVLDNRFVFKVDSFGLNPDYSDAISNPCGTDIEFVRSLYQSILGRDVEVSITGEGKTHLISLQNGGTRKALILAFFHSQEYQNKHTKDLEFIRDVYQSILAREPNAQEKSIGILNRDDFIEQIFNTNEYKGIIASCPQTNKDKEIKLNSINNFCYSFIREEITARPNLDESYDLLVEPWCTDRPALCGNFIELNIPSFDNITAIPATGYLSDDAGYGDCVEVNVNKIYINKNRDGTHTAFEIVSHTKPSNCEHNINILYRKLD